MKVKIVHELVNDNMSVGKVINSETGELVENIVAVNIHLSSQGCFAELTVINPDIDVDVHEKGLTFKDAPTEDLEPAAASA